MDVVEDTTLGIEGVATFSKFCKDTLAVIFINVTSLHTFLLVRRLAGTDRSQDWQWSSVSETYADMGKESIHSATCVEDSMIPFRPPFPIFIGVCSLN